MECRLRWLGVAGFEIITEEGTHIFIDPWLSGHRFGAPFGAEDIKEADFILVTHGHFDHAEDVADIAVRTGAKVVAAQEEIEGLNAWAQQQGKPTIPTEQIIAVTYEQELRLNDIIVFVTKAEHPGPDDLSRTFLGRETEGLSQDELMKMMLQEMPSLAQQMSQSMGFMQAVPSISKGFFITTEHGFRLWHVGSTTVIPEIDKYASYLRPNVAMVQATPTNEIRFGFELTKKIMPPIVIPNHHDKIFPDQLGVGKPSILQEKIEKELPQVKMVDPELGKWYSISIEIK